MENLLIPKQAVFYVKPEEEAPSRVAKDPEAYDRFLMCEPVRKSDKKTDRKVHLVSSPSAVEICQEKMLPYVVYLFAKILKYR